MCNAGKNAMKSFVMLNSIYNINSLPLWRAHIKSECALGSRRSNQFRETSRIAPPDAVRASGTKPWSSQ